MMVDLGERQFLAQLVALPAAGRDVRPEVANATDPAVPCKVLDRYDPEVLILVAGATLVMRAIHHQTWETFSLHWQSDVKIAFNWMRAALLKPLRPGSTVVVMSSGAAIHGSPASGGYAGANATQRFIAAYAQEESRRIRLGITVTTVMPRMTPLGAVGMQGVRGYAARSGQTEEEFIRRMGDVLTPEIAGSALVDLVRADPRDTASAYLLTAAGLQEVS